MHKHEEQTFVFHCWYKLACLVRSLIPRRHHWEVTSYLCCTFWQALSVPHTYPSVWSLHLLGFSVEILTPSYLLVLYLYANINSCILIFQFVLWFSYTIFCCSTLLMSGHRNIWYISYCRTETFISSKSPHSRPQRILCVPTVIGTSSVLSVQPAEQGKIWLNCLIPLHFYSSFRINPHKKQTFQLEYLGQFILSFVL